MVFSALDKTVDSPRTVHTPNFATRPPKLRISKSEIERFKSGFHLISIPPLELARQLAIRDIKTFQKIELEEYLHMRWTKDDKEIRSPNVLLSIKQFCDVGYWIAGEIVSEFNLQKRLKVLSNAIKLAHHCLELGNFNGAMAGKKGPLYLIYYYSYLFIFCFYFSYKWITKS